MNKVTRELIEKYFHSFNHNDMPTFLYLLDDKIIHDINQNGRQIGKKEFEQFMHHMNHCYREKIYNIAIMTNEPGTHAAAEFRIEGVYLATDKGFPEAKNQKYDLAAGAFFEVHHNKITRVTIYYNLNEWIRQIS